MSSLQALAAHMLSIMVLDCRMKYAEVHATGSWDLQMSMQIFFLHVHLLLRMIQCCSNVKIIHMGGVIDLRDELPPAPAHRSYLRHWVSINLTEFWMISTRHLAHGIQRWHTFCGYVWAESSCTSEQTGPQCENVWVGESGDTGMCHSYCKPLSP